MNLLSVTVCDVLEPPVIDPFKIPPRKQGDRVTLSCSVSSGDLPIFINWTKDGKPIAPDSAVIVEVNHGLFFPCNCQDFGVSVFKTTKPSLKNHIIQTFNDTRAVHV